MAVLFAFILSLGIHSTHSGAIIDGVSGLNLKIKATLHANESQNRKGTDHLDGAIRRLGEPALIDPPTNLSWVSSKEHRYAAQTKSFIDGGSDGGIPTYRHRIPKSVQQPPSAALLLRTTTSSASQHEDAMRGIRVLPTPSKTSSFPKVPQDCNDTQQLQLNESQSERGNNSEHVSPHICHNNDSSASVLNSDTPIKHDPREFQGEENHKSQVSAANETVPGEPRIPEIDSDPSRVIHIGGLFELSSVTIFLSEVDSDPSRLIHIGGLFELSSSHSAVSGQSELAAARMAIDHVNRQRVIPGYRLHMYENDTKCDPGVGADTFYDLMYRKPQLLMLIATSCSEVATSLGEIVPYWNLVMVSHGATSPALSDRENYPGFFRLAAADSSHNPARKAFIEHCGWDAVATIIEDGETEVFELANNEMTTDFEAVNITLKAILSFRDNTQDLHAKMLKLKNSGARIIIGSFKEVSASHVFCQAFHMELYGPRYVWMLLGSYPNQWWLQNNNTNCTEEQLTQAVEGHFTVDSLTEIIGNGHSISGLTTPEFVSEYANFTHSRHRSMYASLAYDSVWAVALTLKRTLKAALRRGWTSPLERFTYKNGSKIYKAFVNHMQKLQFTGVSGPISFDGPDRRGVSVIEQNQGGHRVRVALFDPKNSSLNLNCVGCQAVVWQGGRVPVDEVTVVVREIRVNHSAFFAVCVASLTGMTIAVVFLAFNIYYRKLKYIKLSSPQLNNMAAVGCVFVYSSVILLGVDHSIIPHINYRALCMGRAYLWVTGFSLAFGAMFAKTYRVHQIFRKANKGILRSKLLKDKQLLLLIGGLLVVDSVVMSLWIAIDPMDKEVFNLSAEPSPDLDLLYIPQLSRCNCDHLQKWMGSLYAYKGLLLLFGVYMAWETRHVQILVLNDSQYIGMNIYNVVLSSVTVVVLSTVLTVEPTVSYCLISALIIISTTGLLGLLFFPKIYDICKNSGSPIVTTSGMTFEGNTRRFVVDEKKEKYYRAEVENRFLKRKLTQLDQEIAQLERMLQPPSETFYKPSDEAMVLLPESATDNNHLIINKDAVQESNIPVDCTRDKDCNYIPELTLYQKTGSSNSNSNPYSGDCSCEEDNVFENSMSDTKEPEITSDMGHTDADFEEMMSEMGPPGMLTLIFNNDHTKQSHQSLYEEEMPRDASTVDKSDGSSTPLLSQTSVARPLKVGSCTGPNEDHQTTNNISARNKSS